MDDFQRQIEQFLNEQRADMLVLDTVLKTLITRLLPDSNQLQFLAELEQQSLQTALAYGPEGQTILAPRVETFFQVLREWLQKAQTTNVPTSSTMN